MVTVKGQVLEAARRKMQSQTRAFVAIGLGQIQGLCLETRVPTLGISILRTLSGTF